VKKLKVIVTAALILSMMSNTAIVNATTANNEVSPQTIQNKTFETSNLVPLNSKVSPELIQSKLLKSGNADEIFTVDNVENGIRIISATYNAEKTSKLPLVGLTRVNSIANGQTNSISTTNSVQKVNSIGKTTQSNNSYSFGVSLDTSKKTGLLGSVLSKFVTAKISLNQSFENSRFSSTTNTVLEASSENYTENFSVPAGSDFALSNSADFYTTTGYEVYDMVVELTSYANYTANENEGIMSATHTFPKPIMQNPDDPYAQFMCRICKQKLYSDYDGDLYHVVYADGHIEHCGQAEYETLKYYKPGYTPKTTVSFEYYNPTVMKIVNPWKLSENNSINSSRTIQMGIPGDEQMVYYNGAPYIFRHISSYLLTPSENLVMPAEQICSVTRGNSISTNVTKQLQTTSKSERSSTSGNTFSSELENTFFQCLTFKAGYKTSFSSTQSSSSSETKSTEVKENNTYSMPQSFIDQGNSGIAIYLSKDNVAFNVTGEIIPLLSNGQPDESKKQTVTFVHKEEFSRRFALPYKMK
jgi:hypothetical protein